MVVELVGLRSRLDPTCGRHPSRVPTESEFL